MATYVSDIQLAHERGVHRTTIWRWASKGILPKPVQLSPGTSRWIREEIERHDAQLAAARTKSKR